MRGESVKSMKKGIVITGIIVVLCLGSTQLIPVLASEDTDIDVKQEREVLVPSDDTRVKDSSMNEQENETTEETTTSDSTSDLRSQARESEQFDNYTNNLAKDLGIKTEGKDSEEIQAEIRSIMLQEKAKEAGIEVDGKSEEALITELKETYREKTELIKPSSNKYEELRMKPDSRRKQILETAKSHGIETEGNEFDAVVEELKTVLLKEKGE